MSTGAAVAAGRCPWAGASDALRRYHDEEWGVPTRDDAGLLELLVLEGAQAGLSWATVLAKRERYRQVFCGFEPARVAAFTDGDVDRLVADPGIVRHRGKVTAAVANARAVVELQRTEGSFAGWLWGRVDGAPVVRRPASPADVPSRTPGSAELAADLRRRGFAFVGPTVVYAFLQAAGLVDDHLAGCPSSGAGRAGPGV